MDNARTIWTKGIGLSINDSRNLVSLNYNLHRVLHTKVYYTVVDDLVVNAYKKKGKNGVFRVVALIKSFLATVSYQGG